MGKNKKGFAAVLVAVAGVLAIVAALLYNSVMYRYQPVYYMLYGAAALAVIAILLSGFLPRFSSYFPVCIAALLASAAVWGTQLMVNQLGYCVADLDSWSTVMTYFYFVGFSALGMLLAIIASFLRMAKPAK